MANIIITGVAGFIGATLTSRILGTEPNCKVIGLDNLNDYYDIQLKKYRLKKLQSFSNFKYIFADISNKKLVNQVFETFTPNIVVNLAAQAGVRYSLTNPDAYISSNIIGFYNILEACKHFPVEHLVYASSSSVYGENRKIPYSTIDKTDTPVSLYAATKKSNELLAYSYSKLYNIPTTGLRFFTVYGPAGRPDMAYFKFTNALLQGKSIQLFNYGHCKRDFTYIDDIVTGISLIMKNPPPKAAGEDGLPIPPHALYNIGNGSPINLTDFVETLSYTLIDNNILPSNFNINEHIDLVPMQPGDVAITYADTTSLEKIIGFKPQTQIGEGLDRFAKWYKGFYLS